MKLRDLIFLSKKILQLDPIKWSGKIGYATKNEKREATNYRVVIIKETDLKESFSTTLTRKKIYVFVCVCFVINFAIWLLAFSYTPLKAVLPENLNYKEKRKLINLTRKVDSLENLYRLNDNFMQRYKNYFTTTPHYQKDVLEKK